MAETRVLPVLCTLCGEPMPPGETMFKYHGYSGLCPKPPLPSPSRVPLPESVRQALEDYRTGNRAMQEQAAAVVLAALASERERALEQAAQTAERLPYAEDTPRAMIMQSDYGTRIAGAIRALKSARQADRCRHDNPPDADGRCSICRKARQADGD